MSFVAKHIVFFHPDLGIGGAERLVIDAAVGLQELGHKVTIFTSHFDPTHCFDEARNGILDVRTRGNTICPPSIAGRLSILCATIRQLHLVLQICIFTSELHALKPDFFFVDQLSACVPLLRVLCPSARTLFYCHFPDKLLASRKSQLKKIYRVPFDWLEGWSTNASDVIVVNSNFTKEVFGQAFPQLRARQPHVVYPCIPPEVAFSSQLASDHSNPLWPDKKIILSINRFERKKDIGLAIRAFASLSSADRQTSRLVLAGGYDRRVMENVEYHQELADMTESLGLEHATVGDFQDALGVSQDVQVLFMPSVSSDVKEKLLAKAILLVYTPKFEHFGIVPVEAMLAGCPVLAATTGGPKESVLDGHTGWLRSVDDVDAWALVMRQTLHASGSQRLLDMSAQGRRRAQTVFSRHGMAQRLQTEFEDLRKSNSRPPLVTVTLTTIILVFSTLVWPFLWQYY